MSGIDKGGHLKKRNPPREHLLEGIYEWGRPGGSPEEEEPAERASSQASAIRTPAEAQAVNQLIIQTNS